MNLIYIISIVVLMIPIILIKKTDKKINFLIMIPILMIIYMCYIALVAYIMHLVNIVINSISIGTVNLLLAGIIGFKIYKKKEIQRYHINKKDLIFLAIFLTISVFIIYQFFGKLNRASYISDGVIHYTAARQFSLNERLFKDMKSDTICINPVHMPMAYVNEGLIMNSLENICTEENFISVFIIFDSLYWVLGGYIFFYLIKNKAKGNMQKIIVVLITLIYFLGYPLNSMLSGFHYLHLGILIISTIILIIINGKKYKIKGEYIYIALLNLGVMFTYNLFVPVVYGALFMYYIRRFKLNKDLIKYIIITLIIPGLIGIDYYIFAKNASDIVNKGIIIEGFILRNEWSNFIIFIPFSAFYIYQQLKNKKNDVTIYMFFLIAVEAGIIIMGNKFGKISTYYFYKMYYIFQLVLFYLAFLGMKAIIEKEKQIMYIPIIVITVVMLIAYRDCRENKYFKYSRDEWFPLEKDNIMNITKVYRENRKIFNRDETNWNIAIEK